MIVSRKAVRAALDRALALSPDLDAAILAVAASLGLPVEAVAEVAEGVEA